MWWWIFRRLFPAANWVDVPGANICCRIASWSDIGSWIIWTKHWENRGNCLGFFRGCVYREGTTGGFLKGLLSPLPFGNLWAVSYHVVPELGGTEPNRCASSEMVPLPRICQKLCWKIFRPAFFWFFLPCVFWDNGSKKQWFESWL